MVYSSGPILFNNQKKYVDKVVKKVKALEKKKGLKIDSIAFRGVSGAMIAPVAAYRLKKDILAVRKGENAHSSSMVEGDRPIVKKNYVIVDDLIDSGKTVKEIVKQIWNYSKNYQPVGIVLYQSDRKNDFYSEGEEMPFDTITVA